MKWLRNRLRKWLGIEELEQLAKRTENRAEIRAMGLDPDDPLLVYKLSAHAAVSNPRAQTFLTNVRDADAP